jgi:hypothetical protein
MGLLFGIILLTFPINTQILISNYGNLPDCRTPSGSPQPCNITFTVDTDLSAPVHVYYQIENFIANSKDYINSRSHKQLTGNPITMH